MASLQPERQHFACNTSVAIHLLAGLSMTRVAHAPCSAQLLPPPLARALLEQPPPALLPLPPQPVHQPLPVPPPPGRCEAGLPQHRHALQADECAGTVLSPQGFAVSHIADETLTAQLTAIEMTLYTA